MLKIRLQRVGKKHDPSYRVVLTDSRQAAKAGTCIELLGNYNPQRGEPVLKGDRIKEWISKGAQTSDTVNNLLVKHGVIEGKKRDVLHHTKIAAKRAKKAPKVEAPAPAPTPTLDKKVEDGAPTPAGVGEAEEPKVEIKEEAPAVEEVPVVGEVKEEAVAEEAPAETPTSENVGEETPVV
jgi:small subunit ribosomal protein S16